MGITNGKHWTHSYSGNKLFITDFDADSITLEDIVHVLAGMPRFGAHAKQHFSVAEHSVKLSHLVKSEFALHALFHDTDEVIMVDLPSPIKTLPEISFYTEICKDIQTKIYKKFSISPPFEPPEVKELDSKIVYTEAIQVFKKMHPDFPIQEIVPGYIVEFWKYKTAKRKFLERYEQLKIR